MPASKDENRALAKAARTVMIKSILDLGEVQVSATDGYVELTGKVRPPRSHAGTINMKTEVQALQGYIRGVRGVKDVYISKLLIVE